MKAPDKIKQKGSFTLPGEAGYEKLTMELAQKWGADIIRDSDGTRLSEELLASGYGIYSTLCIIRDHNPWAGKNLDKLQQSFLCTGERVATGEILEISVMEDFYSGQFRVNASTSALDYWQIYDRTQSKPLSRNDWSYEKDRECVIIHAKLWHKYTVSFLAWRIWEEISMYNHVTNNWDKEHLMQIDPAYPETQEYLLEWLENWCVEHPDTDVVRFTSLFYNFAWIWGANGQGIFSDWASYDFTVSDYMLKLFEKQYGYALTAENFVNQGKYRVTHMPPDRRKRDWMEFIGEFVLTFGKKLVDITHKHNKKAYVFYDDSWVGMEPYSGRFNQFGFDGIIKCVFSGYEARLCAGVEAPVHEIRFHPYLFPVGLGGAPTFADGGNPALDAKNYWINIRRALLREKMDRAGLGGYLHLTENFPDFIDTMTGIVDEFRAIKTLHEKGAPLTMGKRVAVLHAWGALRSWTLSGHFHETYRHDLIHVLESLSGLPFDVKFISFEDVKDGALSNIDVIINAGFAGSAWSGGNYWKDDNVVSSLTKWVHDGGVFIGINEPSAVAGYDRFFRMSHVFGVDLDDGSRICHGRWPIKAVETKNLFNVEFEEKPNIYLTDGKAKVLKEENGYPVFSEYEFGGGKGIYMSSFRTNKHSTYLLRDLILQDKDQGSEKAREGLSNNPCVECAVFPNSRIIVFINNTDEKQNASIFLYGLCHEAELDAYETRFVEY